MSAAGARWRTAPSEMELVAINGEETLFVSGEISNWVAVRDRGIDQYLDGDCQQPEGLAPATVRKLCSRPSPCRRRHKGLKRRIAMMRRVFLLIPAVLGLLLYGCVSAQGYPDRSSDLQSDLKMLETYHQPDLLQRYAAATNKRELRDEVVNGRILAIDLHFAKFAQGLSRENNWTNLGLDWTILGLGGAGAIVADTGTKGVLAAFSGGLTGAKGSVDKNLFFNKTMPVILSQMEAKRKTVLVNIRTKMALDESKYPLTEALIDLEDYYSAGTIPGAIISLTAESGEMANEAEEKLNEVTEGKFLDDKAGRAIRAFWKPDGKTIDPDNQEKLLQWMKDNRLESVSIPFFTRDAGFKEERLHAVEDLDLTLED